MFTNGVQFVTYGAVGGHDFEVVTLAFGGLLVVGALFSGLARRSFLSLTALFVLAGFLLGHGALDVLPFRASSSFVGDLALVALIGILFRDGLEVDSEMLQRQWRLPPRKLVPAMPITGALIATVTDLLTDLGWTESFLVGANLAALTVFVSIIAHGLTDTPGANWLARRYARG